MTIKKIAKNGQISVGEKMVEICYFLIWRKLGKRIVEENYYGHVGIYHSYIYIYIYGIAMEVD